MVVLIVGADKIGAFVPKLEELGAEKVLHWSARSQKVSKNCIPASADLVIFCTDFLHHTAARTIKKKVKERGLPAVYCRRAWTEIAPEVEQLLRPEKSRQKHPCEGCQHCRCKRRHH
ncbi:hypothetical protein SAMN05660420_00275 [Desulfuromusa kysingii]|uniref:DUF2325 domain-containing protein n=1 Tax=Desulfuromusa kysingii TaxID=37625 RepID=A0A1H3VTT8_9BACT|nr:DUF2325 domain-containing protein [Desulfuromusa kysingii]SDZ78111.1 hypothetical protein SAMN05660420_00275 [Desulfuromusa kysingii]